MLLATDLTPGTAYTLEVKDGEGNVCFTKTYVTNTYEQKLFPDETVLQESITLQFDAAELTADSYTVRLDGAEAESLSAAHTTLVFANLTPETSYRVTIEDEHGDTVFDKTYHTPAYEISVTETAADAAYEWSLDGEAVPAEALAENGALFPFTPDAQGGYEVSVTVTDASGARGTAAVRVVCCAEEGTYRRAVTASSQSRPDRIYEYTAAPGQFINEPRSGFDDVATPEAAAQYAAARLDEELYVSLGAWGGYIVAGFDHSIGRGTGGEFSVSGNMFDGSSEPGIVWVMQDTNGNGLPDDEWYELKGSESGKEGTLTDYAVTYYRPSAAGMAVRWRDNRGGEGEVPRNTFHRHDFYYPQWIEADSYTLYGTRLAPNSHTDPQTGNIVNAAYGWGYADNRGSDCEAGGNTDAAAAKCFFDISNAVNADGTAAELQYIDFIKVQTGVNHFTAALGEVSTEVLGFADETL